MADQKKEYYQVTSQDGKSVNFTHCTNIRIDKENFFYLYNNETNSMLVLKKIEGKLSDHIKKSEFCILFYPKWDDEENSIPCTVLSGLDEFSYQLNQALVDERKKP